MLRPGGTIAFCGEPSHYGDRLAALPKRGAHAIAPLWRALMRAPARRNGAGGRSEEDRLEAYVDVHAFTPSDLAGHARGAGFERVRVSGEELAASLFGWANRSLESTAEPDEVPWAWRQYAYRGYLMLQAVDRAAARAAAARRALLQPASVGAQARLLTSRACGGRSRPRPSGRGRRWATRRRPRSRARESGRRAASGGGPGCSSSSTSTQCGSLSCCQAMFSPTAHACDARR